MAVEDTEYLPIHTTKGESSDMKFLMIRNQGGGLTELRVVLNFAEELKALAQPR